MGDVGTISPDLQEEYLVWRLVFEANQLLSEVSNWDLPTLVKANQILDMKADMSAAYTEAAKPERN